MWGSRWQVLLVYIGLMYPIISVLIWKMFHLKIQDRVGITSDMQVGDGSGV